MKKILTAFLALAMVIAMPMTNVFAEEEGTELTTENATSASVDLTATVASKYYVKLPTTVDVSATSKDFYVKVRGDVDNAKQIAISEGSGAHQLADAADSENLVDITMAVDTAINGADIDSDYNDNKITVTITHAELTAGYYTCELPIVISLQNIKA